MNDFDFPLHIPLGLEDEERREEDGRIHKFSAVSHLQVVGGGKVWGGGREEEETPAHTRQLS